jgi:hypothetical protein
MRRVDKLSINGSSLVFYPINDPNDGDRYGTAPAGGTLVRNHQLDTFTFTASLVQRPTDLNSF